MMLMILYPSAFRERTEDSRPGPGPLTRTSRFLTPKSCAARPACSAATWAANGVDLREPRKPEPPAVAHDNVLPLRSVIVMIVLLNDACTCTMPSITCCLMRLRDLVAGFAMNQCSPGIFSAWRYDAHGPCVCGHWCGYAGHAPASHDDDGCRGTCRGPS